MCHKTGKKSWLTLVLTILQLSTIVKSNPECAVNITEGLPWSAGDFSYNFADIDVESFSGVITPNYAISIGTNGDIISSASWNITGNNSGISNGYWESLTDTNNPQFGTIIRSTGFDSPVISQVTLAGDVCDFGEPTTVQPVGKTEAALQPVSVSNGQLIGNDGNALSLKGFNWFGMEVPDQTMLAGLWFGTDSISRNFATIVYRYQILGFNAVRLPMSFKNLYETTPAAVNQPCNVDSQRTIAESTRDPSSSADPSEAPAPIAPSTPTPGECNT